MAKSKKTTAKPAAAKVKKADTTTKKPTSTIENAAQTSNEVEDIIEQPEREVKSDAEKVATGEAVKVDPLGIPSTTPPNTDDETQGEKTRR